MRSYGYISSSVSQRVFSNLGYGTATGNGTTSTITDGLNGLSYTLLSFTSDGTLTVANPGLFEFLLVGGGGGAGNCCYRNPQPQTFACSAGGGGGGVIGFDQPLSIYLGTGTYSMDVGLGGSPYGDTNSYCHVSGMPGRPTRIATTSGIGNNVIIECLGGGGGAGQLYANHSEYLYYLGRGGVNGGGTTWTTGPHYQGEGLGYDHVNRAGAVVSTGYVGFPTGRRGGGGQIANNTSQNQGGGGAGNSAPGGHGPAPGYGGAGGAGTNIATWIGSGTAFVVAAGGGGGGNQSGGPAATGGVAGRTGSSHGNNGVNPGAGGGGTCANDGNRQGGLGAPGAVYVRYRVV